MWKGRDVLNRIGTYVPGKSIEEVRKEFGLSHIDKLASNENPLGPSKAAMKAIGEALEELHRYPDGSCTLLRESVGKSLGVGAGQIIVGNGSDEIIKLLAESFIDRGDKVVMGSPTFSEYDYAGTLMDGEIVKVPLISFAYDLEGLGKAVDEGAKMVFICNPNNPTGTIVSEGAMDAFMKGVPSGTLVVFDEAYGEYAGSEFVSGLKYIKEGYDNVMVLKTFSKMYGLAGLRVGYGIGSEALVGWVLRAKEPFNVNSLAQIGARAAIDDKEHVERSLAANEAGKNYLYEEFEKRGFTYYESHTNFIWVDIKAPCRPVFEALLRKGSIIRPGDVFGFSHCIRVTIGLEEENKRLMANLDEVLGG